MKKIKISIFLILFGTLVAFSQKKIDSKKIDSKKIGFCDFNKVLASTKEANQIQNKTLAHQKEIERLTKEVNDKVEKIKAAPAGDPKIQNEAQASYEKMEKYKMTAYDDVEKLKQNLLPNAQKKIINIIELIAKQKGLTKIFDKNVLLYSDGSDEDITELIIATLNKK